MYQFVTIYYKVDDPALLDDFFSGTHLQLAEKLPGLIKTEVAQISGKPGGQSRYQMAYSLYFADYDSFERALMSEPGVALMQALKQWDDAGLITWYFADAYEELARRSR